MQQPRDWSDHLSNITSQSQMNFKAQDPATYSGSTYHQDLLNKLKAKGALGADYTRGMIKDKLNEDADSEIATTSLRVSLVCPLGKMRMVTPCRASTCQHLQCFDASLYLQMNERKPTWMCPVCDKPAIYDKLVIDGYFQEVLSSGRLSADGNEIQLHSDGSWSSLIKKEHSQIVDQDVSTVMKLEPVETLDTEPDIIPQKAVSSTSAPCSSETDSNDQSSEIEVIDLTMSDSDDEPLTPLERQVSYDFQHTGKLIEEIWELINLVKEFKRYQMGHFNYFTN